jgi:calcineurin-like phosphoesterase family protein
MTIFFTSDTHGSHKNLIIGTSKWGNKDKCRKFSTLLEHDEHITEVINSIVRPNDTIYHLGDFAFNGVESFVNFRARINCRNIHLILGNHDQNIDKEFNGVKLNSLFTTVSNYKEIFLNKKRITLFHYPIASWNGLSEPSIHLHGHTHRSPQEKFMNGGLSMDVGVDGNEYKPYSLDEIFEIMEKRTPKTEGHHDKSMDR